MVVSLVIVVKHAQATTFEVDRWDLGVVTVGQTAKTTLKVRNSSGYEIYVRYVDVDPPFSFNYHQQQTRRISDLSLDQFGGRKSVEVNLTPTEPGRFCSTVTLAYYKCPFDNLCSDKKYWEKGGPICVTAVAEDLSTPAISAILDLLFE